MALGQTQNQLKQAIMNNNRFYILYMAASMVLGGLSSCISDDSTLDTNELPTLSIKGDDAETMPTYNIDLGTDCVITPDIAYSGGDASTLQYQWQVGTYVNGQKGDLEDAGTNPTFDYKFKSGGSFYVHLTVTDGRVGKAIDYRVNVNRTFEEGFLLTSTDADGRGNLVFVKTLTPEETAAGKQNVIIEHSFEAMNEGFSEDGLVGAITATVSWPKSLTRVLLSTKEHCYIIDPNNFTVLTDINYTDLEPGFKATGFYNDTYNPYAYDAEKKKYAFINLTYMFPFESDTYADFHPANILVGKYKGYQGVSYATYYPDYQANTVAAYNQYAAYYGGEAFPNTGSNLAGYKLIAPFSALQPDDATYVTYNYIMAQQEATGDVCLWTFSASAQSPFPDSGFSSCKRTATNGETAVPSQGTVFVGSPTYQRMFYYLGNCVYVYLPNAATFSLPTKSQYALKFGDNEEVTFMDTNFDTDELYVATYDNAARRGSLYVYDCKDVRTDNGGNVQPKKVFEHCAGRISSLFYKTSIQ